MGKIITTEWYFVVFDGTMIMLAMLTLNIFHPGRDCSSERHKSGSRGRAKRRSRRRDLTQSLCDARTFCRLATPHSTRTLLTIHLLLFPLPLLL
ncbi:hypothetical protein LXA43DRAFT_714386 [Ganoderma leucocontextum]|nr:hypothetical protein LXA43DRAFT_714386 [Ganoderma leucocontextum]